MYMIPARTMGNIPLALFYQEYLCKGDRGGSHGWSKHIDHYQLSDYILNNPHGWIEAPEPKGINA